MSCDKFNSASASTDDVFLRLPDRPAYSIGYRPYLGAICVGCHDEHKLLELDTERVIILIVEAGMIPVVFTASETERVLIGSVKKIIEDETSRVIAESSSQD